MKQPSILIHPKNQAAFEQLVVEEAKKYVNKSKGQKAGESLIKYAAGVGVIEILGATLGYTLFGGPHGAIEGIKQASIAAVPTTLLFKGYHDYLLKNLPLDNINFVIEKSKKEITNILNYYESSTPTKIIATVMGGAVTAGIYASASLLLEKATGINISQYLIAGIGGLLPIVQNAAVFYHASKYEEKIIRLANQKPDILDESSGNALTGDELARIVDFAMNHEDKASKIYVATSDRRYRGATGALGFLGALDALSDKDRDSCRIKPKISLRLVNADAFNGYGLVPQFEFSHQRVLSRTDTVPELARAIYCNNVDIGLKILPVFNAVTLANLLSAPYENLFSLHIYGQKDDADLFEINYQCGEATDNIEVKAKSREKISVLSDVFGHLYGRHLTDKDFDSELVRLSQESHDMTFELWQKAPDTDAIETLNLIKAVKSAEDKTKDKPEVKIHEKLEDPLSLQGNSNILENIVPLITSICKQNKHKILPAKGYDSLVIALEGLVYSLSPRDKYQATEKALYLAFSGLFNPIKSINCVLKEGEIIPGLRDVKLASQISGINSENIFDILRMFSEQVPSARIRPCMKSISYDNLWEIGGDLKKVLAENSYSFEIIDENRTKITIHMREPEYSYKTLRDELFPNPEYIRKWLDSANNQENKIRRSPDSLYQKIRIMATPKQCLSIDDMSKKIRYEHELESRTYELVNPANNMPGYVVAFNGDSASAFFKNCSVSICTNDNIFRDVFVHPGEAVNRLTGYMYLLKEIVDKASIGKC